MGLMEAGRTRIAVVDDDPAIREVVGDMLASGGMDAVRFACASDFLSQLSTENSFDLIILDLQLPDLDGFSVAANIRTSSSVPIIMLTGRDEELDRVMGLEIGADDYVVKPFSVRELLARVKAIRRRARGDFVNEKPVRQGYRFHGYVMDTERRRLSAPSGAPIALTVAEFDLLHAMVQRHGRVLSRDQLLEITHRAGDDIFDRTIDVLILRLRRKIEPTPTSPRFIKTERGHGYVFNATVEALSDA
ncbi:response regulator transcription factor [Martelella sp. FLE1502]